MEFCFYVDFPQHANFFGIRDVNVCICLFPKRVPAVLLMQNDKIKNIHLSCHKC